MAVQNSHAIYAALTDQLGATLVAWDDVLVQRAGPMTPTTWLATNG